jgi:hypothetical protein
MEHALDLQFFTMIQIQLISINFAKRACQLYYFLD